MSRGGRGGGRGRGGRGGFGGQNALPPMGLTFADIQNLSREATALYPPRHLPVSTAPTSTEQSITALQLGFVNRLRESRYYVLERSNVSKLYANELPRYSDKYRPSQAARPVLKKKELNAEFFPTEVFEDYFNPKRKISNARKLTSKTKINLDELDDETNEEEKSDNERSSQVSEEEQTDYDVDEEYDNDYAENYFDNGEGDDLDNLDGVGGGDEGGGVDYD